VPHRGVLTPRSRFNLSSKAQERHLPGQAHGDKHCSLSTPTQHPLLRGEDRSQHHAGHLISRRKPELEIEESFQFQSECKMLKQQKMSYMAYLKGQHLLKKTNKCLFYRLKQYIRFQKVIEIKRPAEIHNGTLNYANLLIYSNGSRSYCTRS